MIPWSGRSPGVGNSNPLQYLCQGKSHGQMSLVGYSPYGCNELDITEQLNTYIVTYTLITQPKILHGSHFIQTQVHSLYGKSKLLGSGIVGIIYICICICICIYIERAKERETELVHSHSLYVSDQMGTS